MPFRIPEYDDGVSGVFGPATLQGGRGNYFSMFGRPCVYATRVDLLPVRTRRVGGQGLLSADDPNEPILIGSVTESDAWRSALDSQVPLNSERDPASPTLWRNFSYQNTGYQPYIVDATTPLQRLYCRRLGAQGTYTDHPAHFDDVLYPIGDPFSDQGGGEGAGPLYTVEISGGLTHTHIHADAHIIAYRPDTGELWEVYGYQYGNGPGTQDAAGNPSPNCFMGKYYNVHSPFFNGKGGATADESGQIIYPMLPKYSEIQAGAMNHAIRFNAPKLSIRRAAAIWPATNGVLGGVNPPPQYIETFPPMGAWFRLKADFDVTNAPDGITPWRSDTKVFLTTLQQYGGILSDVGEAWSMVGTANENWPAAMLAQLRLIPTSALEFINQDYMSTGTLKAYGDVP